MYMTEEQAIGRGEILALMTEIVSAHLANNAVVQNDVPDLIQSVFNKLNELATGEEPASVELTPAVPIKKSVQPDYIVCLDDGKRFKSLKRHLRTTYNLTPDQYRAKWGLAHDYPMVAPNYAAARSELAKQMGLGARRRKTPEPPPPAAPAKGRRKKAA
jgi:predicted transcriptional regulator